MSTSRPNSPSSEPYHHGDLKRTLLAYARQQMELGGLDALSMREMAKAVGVSHTAAYRHFRDKRTLLEGVAIQGFEELLAESAAAEQKAPPDDRARLKAIGLSYVHFGLCHPKLLAHMFETLSQPAAPPELAEAAARLFELLSRRVRAGQQGQLRAGDPRLLSHACWAMVQGLSVVLSPGASEGEPDSLKVLMSEAELALEVFLDGLARREPAAGPSGRATPRARKG